MLKTIKNPPYVILISIVILVSSCVNTDLPERTAETEQQEIDEALANLRNAGYNIDTTKLGVYYVMNKFGTGPYPQSSDTCFMIYTGFFLNGVIFDSSGLYYTDSIWKFNFRQVSLIPGFNDAIELLNKGAEADVIIPSELAYGIYGYGDIPPYTPLVFSMKMKDIRPKK
jgi:FKBP-type peptidyl-prolyl cis-trans isomerase FkpA